MPEEQQNSEIDYAAHKIDGMEYDAWVRKTALDTLKEHAAIKTLCNQDKVTLDAETLASAKVYGEYLWVGSEYYAAYSLIMEPNGVAMETFIEFEQIEYLKDAYFDAIYGKDGKKAISDEQMKKYLADNYVLVNKLEASFSSLKEDEITKKKADFAGYEASLKDGSKKFEEIYLAYNNIKAEDHKHEEPEEGELAPKDSHATVLSAEYKSKDGSTQDASANYKDAKEMAVGDVKVITNKDADGKETGIVLLVKQDISADPYYIQNEDMDREIRTKIVDTELDDEIKALAQKLTCEVNDFSIGQFDVEDIEYPEGYY